MKNKETLSLLGRAAVKYAREGWLVFPCKPAAKEPMVENGHLAATKDLRQVRAWWLEHPEANIGGRPGPSGFVVIDLDSRRAERSAKRLGLSRDNTRACETGRGWHLHHRRPPFTVSNKKLAKGIDVRGDKGYVLLPPSKHPSGARYRWVTGSDEVSELPSKALAKLHRIQGPNAKAKRARPLPDILREGERNERLFSLAATMRRRNASLDAILSALREENARRCQPSLEDKELQAIATSASRYDAAVEQKKQGKMHVAKLSSVRMEPVKWLWQGYLPIGKLVMLDGYPGQGKSAAVLDVAARGSKGRKMPDRSRGDVAGPWDTLILTYEDDAADTLRPRIEAAGGDPARIRYVKGMAYNGESDLVAPTLPQDLAALEKVLKARADIRLVVIDPLMASLSGKVDAHRDQDTRRVTAQLARIASRRKVCIVGIRHFRKHTEGNSITAGGGSIGFIGQARVGLVIDRHPDTDDDHCADVSVLACAKSNLGAFPPSLAFRKTGHSVESPNGLVETLRLEWIGDAKLSADELLARREEGRSHEGGSAVEEWLREMLSDEPVDRRDLMKAARAEGFPVRTVDYVARKIGVVKVRQGSGAATRSFWSIMAENTSKRSRNVSRKN